jgi:hypothetical protein
VKIVSFFLLADLCWPGFVQQDLLYENHKCPCVASAKCLCPKTEIYAFSFENTKMLTCCHTCIRITHTVQTGNLYLWNSFGKSSGILKKRRCFYLCVMSNAFIFDGFLSMGGICFFVFISKTVEWSWLISHSRMFGNKFVWSSWENSLLKKCGCSRCQALWLVGENSWAFM